MSKETDQLALAIDSISRAMESIDQIVQVFYKNLPALAAALQYYAETNDHSLGWVLKKAHRSLRDVLWEEYQIPLNIGGVLWKEYHAPLNKLLSFQEDYFG